MTRVMRVLQEAQLVPRMVGDVRRVLQKVIMRIFTTEQAETKRSVFIEQPLLLA
jgi:hypothetical protein